MDDAELIERVRAGDREAFGPLVARYQGRIYQLCYRVAGNGPDAEDLAHEAFVEAYLKLAQLRDPAKFGAWLRALALNLCRMWYRRRQREAEALLEEPAQAEPEENGSLHQRMLAALSQITAPHRIVLVLHYWEGLPYEEMARFLGVPAGTVMSRLHRARRELKQILEEREEGEEPEMVPDESFRQEVEAEISVLLRLSGQQSEARERLSVLLRRSPERLARLVREAEDEATLTDLALLLRPLRQPAMEAVLSCWQSDEPALQARAVDLLRRSLAAGKPSRTGIPAARIARLDAYLLLDTLFAAPMEEGAKAGLLIELLGAGPDEQTLLLMTNALLCYPEAALARLMERFWQMPAPQALYRPPDTLYALARFGTRFAGELLESLGSADARRQALALEGADALARAMTGAGLDLDETPDERVALEARFRRKWAPPLYRDRDAATLQALGDCVAALLDDPRDSVREKALRILGPLRAARHREKIAACARHARPSTCLAALRVLAELGDPASAPLLMEVGRTGAEGERAVAAWALGRLKAEEAVPLLLELAGAPEREVRGAAVTALGEIGGEAARAGLEVMVSACEQYAGRSMRRIVLREKGEEPAAVPRPQMEERIRDGADPPFYIALDAAIRSLPELRSYGETELSRLLAQVCRDYASTRRYLVDEGLMSREAGVYRFTDLGEAVWRVERFIRERYLGDQPGREFTAETQKAQRQ